MAQVWKCIECGYATWEPQDAGDHERTYNNGKLYGTYIPGAHVMDDIGE